MYGRSEHCNTVRVLVCSSVYIFYFYGFLFKSPSCGIDTDSAQEDTILLHVM